MTPSVAGVDGCKGGWIAVRLDPGGTLSASVFSRFADLLEAIPADAIVAVDMPIGLPDFLPKGGRGPEAVVRPLLGQRRSSVFAIPSRAAVYAYTAPFSTLDAWHAAHQTASAMAQRTSDPPQGVSIQAFGIFAKIRELDGLLIEAPGLRDRVIESHPELAFWRLNGKQAMCLPKKIAGKVNPAGMEERRQVLAGHGVDDAFLDGKVPAGASRDDFFDAAALMLVAGRFHRGIAEPFPNPPGRDRHGLPIAIWA